MILLKTRIRSWGSFGKESPWAWVSHLEWCVFGSRSSSDLVSLRHLLTEACTLHTRPSRPLIFLECGSCFCPRVFVLYALVELFFLVITRCVLALCLLWGLHLTLFNLPQYSCCFSSPSLPFTLLICYSVLAFFSSFFFPLPSVFLFLCWELEPGPCIS